MRNQIGAALVTAALALSAVPAYAETVKTDPSDDVFVLGGWEVEPDVKAAAELSRVTLEPGPKTIRITWRVGEVHPDANADNAILQRYSITFNRIVNGLTYSRDFSLQNDEAKVRMSGTNVPQHARCQRAVVKYRARNARITLPYACMGDFTRGSAVAQMHVRVSAFTTGDRLDATEDVLVAKRFRLR